jgi:hypothetical protein
VLITYKIKLPADLQGNVFKIILRGYMKAIPSSLTGVVRQAASFHQQMVLIYLL